MKRLLVGLLLGLIILADIASAQGERSLAENPKWLEELIMRFQNGPKRSNSFDLESVPRSVWSYNYKGRTVYYFEPSCFDCYFWLFDADGRNMCAPQGGLHGKGDGQCADVFANGHNGKLVWERSR